jgi:type II secretory pathway pseudopilin PulG
MSSICPKPSRSAGFSLGEVLVALAIAAMMTAMLTRFYAGTRANAAKVGEILEVTTLGETLLTRVASSQNLKAGRTDGRTGVFAWRIDVTPVAFAAVARRVNEKRKPATAEDDKDGKNKSGMLSTMSLSTMSASTSFGAASAPAPAATPKVEWVSYRVAVSIVAPSGRRHAVDTIRIGPAQAGER